MLLISRQVILDAAGNGTDNTPGAMLMVDTLSAGASVDVTWIDPQGHNAGTVAAVLIGRKLHAGGDFSGVRLTGAPGAVVGLLIGPDGADAGNSLTTSVVIGHVIVDAPMPSTPVTGPLTDAQLRAATVPVQETLPAALTNVVPVACTAVIAATLAVNAARRKVVFRNVGANPVALVAAAGTFANAAIVLQPTEMWVEKEAPGAAWYAICDAGLASTLNIVTGA